MRTIDITAEQWRARARTTDERARLSPPPVEPVAGPEGLSSTALVDTHLPLAELVAGLAARPPGPVAGSSGALAPGRRAGPGPTWSG